MANFNEYYNSFSSFYNSFLRGNEIEFEYKNKRFYVLPVFVDEKVIGVRFGEAYSENDTICFCESELYNVCIENSLLGEISSSINIVWNNF